MPDSADMGRINSRIISAFDEYKRRLSECETRRQEYIHTLQNPDQNNNNLEITLLTYVIGLDSVICTGTNLLKEIKSQYPSVSGASDRVPPYSPIKTFVRELEKAADESRAERLKNKKPNKSSVTLDSAPSAPP